MDASTRSDIDSRLRQQEVVAELGQQALEATALDQVLQDAAAAVAGTLAVDHCWVLELVSGGDQVVFRRGVRPEEGVARDEPEPFEVPTRVRDALDAGEPIVVDDASTEPRYGPPDVLRDAAVVGGITAIVGSPTEPWGVLEAYATEPREFADHEVAFVGDVASVLGSATENERLNGEFGEMYGRISDAFFALDDEWRFTRLNEQAHGIINPEGETLVGKNIWEAFPAAVDRRFKEKYERAMHEQETVTFEEYYPEPLDAWFEVSAYPSETGLSVYFRDITDRKKREQELQEVERRFEAVFEDPNILVGLLDPDGTVLDINGTAMEYIDADLDAVTGEPFWETPWWGEGDDVSADVKEWTERAAAGEYVDFEADLTRPDGERYVLDGFFRPVTNDDGDVVSIIVSDRDVTERKEHERRYRTLVENFPNGAVALVDEDLRYRTVGGDPRATANLSADEVEGELIQDVLPPELAAELVPGYEAAIAGESSSFEVEREGGFFQFQIVPVRDDDGDIFGAMGMSQDVTEQRVAGRKLEESERRYRTLVENFPNGSVGLFDEDLRYTAVGGQLMDRLGVDPEDRIGHSIHDIHPDEFVKSFEPHFRSALDGEQTAFEIEYRGRYLSAHTLPVRNESDEVFAGMLVVQDVTERREAQQELRRSEAKFRMLAENLEEIVWMATADGDEFVYINPAFEEVWDLDRERLYDEALSFLDVIHPEDRERVRESFLALPEDEYDEEFRIRRSDGEVRWIHARGTTVEDGEMARIVGVGQDVTDRVERERSLERALDLLHKMERIADVAGWEVDPETGEAFWSDHLFELVDVDYDEQPSLEQALDVYETEEDRAIVEETVEEALDTGEPFDLVARFSRPEGDVGRLRIQGEPEVVDGEVVSLRGAAQDVTERIEREQRLEELIDKLEESNERLEQFAYAASHDLQEPLRMVSSYLQLIEQRYADELDEDGEEFIEFAVDGAERMREMIDGLLKYSRVETRGDPFEPVDLNAVVAEVREDLQIAIEESDAEITVESLPQVEGDAGQLRQVFQNLLDNAIEYSGDDPPHVHVSAERDGTKWVISVRDEGVGIDPSDADRVFEVFQSLHTPEEHSGTGIGLALCERIVERHGGDIWVDTEPGVGSTFSFTLPAGGEP